DGIRDRTVTGVQTCALPILLPALLVAPLAVGCGRQTGQDVARTDVQNLMEKQLGKKSNASSPLTLADVKDKLRRGMLIEEFDRRSEERRVGKEGRARTTADQ